MNIKKIINSALTIMGLALVAAGAQAQTTEEFASVTGGNNTFIYTGRTASVTGGLTMTPSGFYASLDVPKAGSQTNNPATVVFTGLANNGNTNTFVPFLGAPQQFSQSLTGGGFNIYDGTTTSGQLLLSGNFAGATLSGTLGTNASTVDTNFLNVAYTGGLYANTAGISLNTVFGNSFNFSLLNVTPKTSVSSGNLNNFQSAGNGQFTGVAPAPEPATLVPFALGGLGLLGLIVRKTRRTNGAAA